MITFSVKYRSSQSEIMDDHEFQGSEMQQLLGDLRTINKWLGGNTVTLSGIRYLIDKQADPDFTIVDLGCGDGEILRKCLSLAGRRDQTFHLEGIDVNEHILEEACSRSKGLDKITFRNADVFSPDFQPWGTDIFLATLFLHHFSDEEIIKLLTKLLNHVKAGIVVNDLHRSPWAFGLYKIFSSIFLKTKTARHDGLVSIARGFRRKDLEWLSQALEEQSNVKFESRIRWKWAFRYQWILKKTT